MHVRKKLGRGRGKEIVAATCQRREADALRSQQKAKQLKVRVKPIYSQRQVLFTGLGFLFFCIVVRSLLEIEFRFLIYIEIATVERVKLLFLIGEKACRNSTLSDYF